MGKGKTKSQDEEWVTMFSNLTQSNGKPDGIQIV